MDYHKAINQSPTFCPAPWTSLNIDQRGQVYPCMASGYCLGNVKQKNIQEILHDEPVASMKQAQARGEWHEACRECQSREQYGDSPRTMWRIDSDTVEKIIADTENFFQPEHLTLNWSNLCNLTCTYCNAETSTAWQSIKGIPIQYVRNEHDALINIIAQNQNSLRGLSLGGGEPLLQKGLPKLLEQVDPTNVNVLVTTNLTVDLENNPVYQVLRTWPRVDWMISFDNADKDKFEYVRDGASWDAFCRNIDTLKKDNQRVWAHPAYSVYCALELDHYYEFCLTNDLDIFWCDLSHPWDLDIRRHSAELRQLAIEQIDLVIAKYQSGRFSFDTLLRYRQQLQDPSYLIPGKIDLKKFSQDIEAQLKKSTSFEQLWPNIFSLL